ncbi:MAG: hypothetical protein AAF449_04100 [Myxococcota bacterium]
MRPLLFCVAVLFASCSDRAPKGGGVERPQSPERSPPSASAASIPVPADYAEQTQASITAQNYKAMLDRIAQQLETVGSATISADRR